MTRADGDGAEGEPPAGDAPDESRCPTTTCRAWEVAEVRRRSSVEPPRSREGREFGRARHHLYVRPNGLDLSARLLYFFTLARARDRHRYSYSHVAAALQVDLGRKGCCTWRPVRLEISALLVHRRASDQNSAPMSFFPHSLQMCRTNTGTMAWFVFKLPPMWGQSNARVYTSVLDS